MTNYDVAESFFENPNGSFERASMNVSYGNKVFYSYSTPIARIAKDINGNDVLLVSNNNLSVTTSKHIGNLLSANCRYENLKLYRLPQQIRGWAFDCWDVFNKIERMLKYLKDSNLRQKPNRENFIHNYGMLESLLCLEDFKEFASKIKTLLTEYKDTMEFVVNYKRGK